MRSSYVLREVQPFDTCMKQWQTPSSELQSNQTKTIEITGTHDCIIVSVVNNTINVLKELLFFYENLCTYLLSIKGKQTDYKELKMPRNCADGGDCVFG